MQRTTFPPSLIKRNKNILILTITHVVMCLCCRCPYLHRTAGDTERRYHLRYYKTCTCVHETDARGHCVKNGPHCAFAHGAHDLRPPVYDVREVQSGSEGVGDQAGCGMGMGESPLGSSLEKDRIINEDPRWNGKSPLYSDHCLQ